MNHGASFYMQSIFPFLLYLVFTYKSTRMPCFSTPRLPNLAPIKKNKKKVKIHKVQIQKNSRTPLPFLYCLEWHPPFSPPRGSGWRVWHRPEPRFQWSDRQVWLLGSWDLSLSGRDKGREGGMLVVVKGESVNCLLVVLVSSHVVSMSEMMRARRSRQSVWGIIWGISMNAIFLFSYFAFPFKVSCLG